MREHKIVVLGSMGAGKTTLVRTIAGNAVVDTDVTNTDRRSDKLATTVAMDYADVDLPNGDRLRLYGSPGQQRFDFIWPILLQGASGVLLLLDASRRITGADLDGYLEALRQHAANVPLVIGATRIDLAPDADLDGCITHVAQRLRPVPVVPVDTRDDAQAMLLMDVLMSEIEAHDLVGEHG